VRLDLNGQLDQEKLQSAFEYLVARHDVFRSSIHWEKIKTPVQVIHPKADHSWQYVDLRSESKELQEEYIEKFKEEDRAKGFDFNKASISRVTIFQLSNDHHLLIWSCHHLLLDGWSSANIIRELAEVYDVSKLGQPPQMPLLPSTKEYRKDLIENDMTSAEYFWKEYLKGFDKPSLVSNLSTPDTSNGGFSTMKFLIDDQVFRDLEAYIKTSMLTMTSALQMAWAIVLSGIENSNDVVFGNIVSVRSPRLKNGDLMCGLFTNMLPVRVSINSSDTISTLGDSIQKSQSRTRDFAYASLDNLQEWADWPGYLPLFDHIFVVENFPWKDIVRGNVAFSNFRSGITSSYPLTVVAKMDDCLKLDFIFDQSKLSEEMIKILGNNLTKVLKAIGTEGESSLESILNNLSPVEILPMTDEKDLHISGRAQNHQIDQPSNPIELTLTGIWENLFMRDGIGVHDNFFDIGGKSLMAVRLFQSIQKQLDVNAPPIMILQYPTISKLAAYIGGDKMALKWKSLVPLRVKGNRNPLFCLHAKGGYVFFYNAFTTYLNENIPVYALQPRGLNGEDPLYNSIEEMATHYIQEIKTIQPQGPYSILATCFSNAVGLEMAQQLQAAGDRVEYLFMVDAAPGTSLDEKIKKLDSLTKVKYKIKNSVVYTKSKQLYDKLKGVESPSFTEEDFSIKHEKHLEKIFDNYQRKPYAGKITLFRSREFENLKGKDFHIEDWLKIVSEDNLEILSVEGHHQTLFLEPEVQNLAKAFNHHLA
jgi:thioesterase domain-containing protein/acyl carrier protein